MRWCNPPSTSSLRVLAPWASPKEGNAGCVAMLRGRARARHLRIRIWYIGLATPPGRLHPRIREVVVLDRHPGFLRLLSGERALEELARERRQHRVGDDVVDHAAARVGI